MEKLKDATFVKRLSFGTGLYGFEFSSGGMPIYVLWSNKDTNVDFIVDASFKTVRIANIVTELGQSNPKVKAQAVRKGKVELKLTSNPIFLEPLLK